MSSFTDSLRIGDSDNTEALCASIKKNWNIFENVILKFVDKYDHRFRDYFDEYKFMEILGRAEIKKNVLEHIGYGKCHFQIKGNNKLEIKIIRESFRRRTRKNT